MGHTVSLHLQQVVKPSFFYNTEGKDKKLNLIKSIYTAC